MLRNPLFLADPAPHKPRAKRETDARHLAFVRTLPCCICHRPGFTEAHHLMRGVVRGMGRKADDKHVIPLCHDHHQSVHESGNEVGFLWGNYRVDGPALAAALYSVSGDFEEAVRILG